VIATSSNFQDPMVEMREKGVDKDHSGVYCPECHAELTRLDAQWGRKFCQACVRAKAAGRKVSVKGSDNAGLIVIGRESAGRPAVPLGDIDDIFAYVERVVERRFYGLAACDREEYVSEGVAIAYKLHRDKWRRDLQPSFSKYLSTLLWQRLKDYWRSDIRQQGRGRRKQDGGFEATPVDSLDERREAGIEYSDGRTEGLAA
jgi:hypothetical protein